MATTRFLFVWFITYLYGVNCLPEVVDLKGNPDFRSVKLTWKSKVENSPRVQGAKTLPEYFVIKYCEDQAWGKYRCRKQIIDDPSKNEVDTEMGGDGVYRIYESSIDGLRMATNYTFEVESTRTNDTRGIRPPERGRALGERLFLQTKGFYARAINCLVNSSLIEIETGPYFGGKISVEGSTRDECYTQGDFSSPKSSYLLRINHTLCGSEMTNSSVKTYVIVQENLPILTHSTRRFMVVCKYVPETFTVRAGVNLPQYGEVKGMVPVDNSISEVDPSDLFDPRESLFNSRVAKQVGRALKFSSEEKEQDSQRWSHLVLMVVLIMSTIIGITCAAIHYIRQTRKSNNSGLITPQDDISTIESNEGEMNSGDSVINRDFMGSSSMSTDHEIHSPYSTNADILPGTANLTQGLRDNYTTPSPAPDFHDDSTNFTDNSLTVGGNELVPNDDEFSKATTVVSPKETQGPESLISFIPGNHSNSVPIDKLESIDAVFDEAFNTPSTNP